MNLQLDGHIKADADNSIVPSKGQAEPLWTTWVIYYFSPMGQTVMKGGGESLKRETWRSGDVPTL